MVADPLLSLLGPGELGKTLADRARGLRLQINWTRSTLARRAGVTVASLKRFETSGKASLELLLRIAFALGRLEELERIFLPGPAGSVEELERRSGPRRERGRL